VYGHIGETVLLEAAGRRPCSVPKVAVEREPATCYIRDILSEIDAQFRPCLLTFIPYKTVFAIWGFTDPYIRVVQTKRFRATGSQYGRPRVILCMATASTLSPRTTLINKVPIS
jgi:hypothetical protein